MTFKMLYPMPLTSSHVHVAGQAVVVANRLLLVYLCVCVCAHVRGVLCFSRQVMPHACVGNPDYATMDVLDAVFLRKLFSSRHHIHPSFPAFLISNKEGYSHMLGDVVAQLLNVDITGVQLRLHFEVASRHFLNDESANDALFAWRDPICASSFPWVGEDAEELQRQYLEVKRAYMERALMISESDLRCDYVGVSYKLVMESFEWMARHRADVAVEQHRNLHSHSATYNEETEERVRKAFSNFFDDCRAEMLREFTKYYLLFIQEGFLTNDLVVHEMRRKLNCFMSLPQSVEAEFHRAREVQYTVLADAVEELVTAQQDPGQGAEVAASLRAYKTSSTVANKRALEDALSRVHRDIYLIDPMEAPIPAEGTGPCVLCPSYSDEVICATLQRINAFCTEVAETKERSLHYEAPTPGGVESTIITYLQSSVGPIAYTSVVNPIVAPVYHCAAYISCDGCSQVRLFAGVSNQIPTGRLEDFHAVGFASGDLCFACTVQHYRESTRRLWRALHPNPRIQRGFVYGCGTRMKVLKTTVVLEEDGPHVHLSVGFAPLGVRGCVWQLPSSSSPAQQRLWQEEEMPEDLMDPVGTPPPTWANTCRMMHIQHNDGADLSCPICLAPFDGLDPTMRTRCGHVFHVDCIRTFASWRTLGEDAREEFDRNPKLCPMCREENFLPDVNDADAMCEQHNIFHYDLLLDMAAEEAELMIPNDERGKCVRVGVAGLLASDACYHNPTTVFACDVVQILVPHAPTPCS